MRNTPRVLLFVWLLCFPWAEPRHQVYFPVGEGAGDTPLAQAYNAARPGRSIRCCRELWHGAGEGLISNRPLCQDEVDGSIPDWAHTALAQEGGRGDD